jgi:hypothetical protein
VAGHLLHLLDDVLHGWEERLGSLVCALKPAEELLGGLEDHAERVGGLELRLRAVLAAVRLILRDALSHPVFEDLELAGDLAGEPLGLLEVREGPAQHEAHDEDHGGEDDVEVRVVLEQAPRAPVADRAIEQELPPRERRGDRESLQQELEPATSGARRELIHGV